MFHAKSTRRALVGLLCTLAVVGPAAFAQDAFPSAPIRIVVPYPPGGFTDILGRLIADKLQGQIGQSVIVENKGGGGSTIGSAMVARAPADGYTLLLVAPDLAINESLMEGRLSYDARKNFSPVIQAAWSPMVLVTHPSLPVKNFAEFIALAKAKPGSVTVGSGGSGTGAHLALELLKSRAGVDLVHVPYKGNGPATSDLLGGQVSAMFLQYAVAGPHIQAGKLRVLATPSGQRSPAMPDVPTVAESGLPGFDVQPWFGIVAPAGTPAAVVNKLHGEIAKVMQRQDVRERLTSAAATPATLTPKEFGAFIDSEVKRWAGVVKASGAKAE
jgi:tripartite-type tricarboxylate transporter receptor subunit TctC